MGRKRKFLAIDRMELVGGALCLDLTNTTGARVSADPRDRLHDYADLLVWGRRVGLVSIAGQKQLAALAAAHPRGATMVLARVRALREDLYQLLRQIASGEPRDARLVRRLGRHWKDAQRKLELVPSRAGFALRPQDSGSPLDFASRPVVENAVELVTSDRLTRLRRCAECDWLFLDQSHGGSRRWCKARCGNRARARKLYRRSA